VDEVSDRFNINGVAQMAVLFLLHTRPAVYVFAWISDAVTRSDTAINVISVKSETDTKDHTVSVPPDPRLTARHTTCQTSGSTVL
jgi:hypothetical protein